MTAALALAAICPGKDCGRIPTAAPEKVLSQMSENERFVPVLIVRIPGINNTSRFRICITRYRIIPTIIGPPILPNLSKNGLRLPAVIINWNEKI